VYCAVRGVPSSRSVAKLPAMPGGEPPRVLPLNDAISLIVSDVPADTYASGVLESRLSDLDWVALCGTAHHAVADEIVQKQTLVPFRLFTLFSSDAKAVATLGRRARDIEAALTRVSGKGEFVLKISKPGAGAARGAGRGARGALGARSAEGASSGTSFLQKKAAAKREAIETAKRVREDAHKTYDTLAGMAAEATFREVDGAAGLVLDASFLVPTRELEAFKRALSTTAAGLLEAGCRVSLTGPWPPYSFVAFERASRG
jgi:gas vesicle protein GvpL/GvpF